MLFFFFFLDFSLCFVKFDFSFIWRELAFIILRQIIIINVISLGRSKLFQVDLFYFLLNYYFSLKI